MRYLDAQPVARMGEAIATVVVLLTDPRARREALDLLLPRAGGLARHWDAAATGISPDAPDLLSIARAGLARLLPGWLPLMDGGLR